MVGDLAALLQRGSDARIYGNSLLGPLCLELLLVAAAWALVWALCEARRRVLHEILAGISPKIELDAFLRLRNADYLAAQYDRTILPADSRLLALGRWITLAATVCTTIPVYVQSLPEPLSFAVSSLDDDPLRTESCRYGRKLHSGQCMIFMLLALYAQTASQGRAGHNQINVALRIITALPALVSARLRPCWQGRELAALQASPLANMFKVLVLYSGLETMLPTIQTQHSALLYYAAVSVLPMLLCASIAYLVCFLRESNKLRKFLEKDVLLELHME
eukprot:jgi/Tetstr1/420741/TSEL_011818.t1